MEKRKQSNTQELFNMDTENKPTHITLSKKALYEELRKLGFHHSWGRWISDKDKMFRIITQGKGKGYFNLLLGVRGNHFDYRLTSQKMFSIEDLGKQIFEYYRFKKLNPSVATHIDMKELPHTKR